MVLWSCLINISPLDGIDSIYQYASNLSKRFFQYIALAILGSADVPGYLVFLAGRISVLVYIKTRFFLKKGYGDSLGYPVGFGVLGLKLMLGSIDYHTNRLSASTFNFQNLSFRTWQYNAVANGKHFLT